jgi:hypothetical protein
MARREGLREGLTLTSHPVGAQGRLRTLDKFRSRRGEADHVKEILVAGIVQGSDRVERPQRPGIRSAKGYVERVLGDRREAAGNLVVNRLAGVDKA